ncbi:linker histone H1 and H5 family [Popillia japonica]|uniref:Linker histone H1 and H5 family n=1 Tax=Popillia japonica TaxID=7064 RepID=A0AAW1MIJ7_POPJA
MSSTISPFSYYTKRTKLDTCCYVLYSNNRRILYLLLYSWVQKKGAVVCNMYEQEEVPQTVWSRWILAAIRKIRSQKQRPSVERICHAIKQHHNYHEDVVAEHLETAVKQGTVLKVYNKGQSSYKDPGGLQTRTLNIEKGCDLSKVVAKAVRELGERDGSTLKSIEKYVRQSHTIIESVEKDLKTALTFAVKRAVSKQLIFQEGKTFKYNFNHPSPGAKRKLDNVKGPVGFGDDVDMQPKVNMSCLRF